MAVFGLAAFAPVADAQALPAGCSTHMGYSTTTGLPCSGTGTVTPFPNPPLASGTFPAGCASGLGYSVTTGLPCNGTTVATGVMAGCTTALGYSVTSGLSCSGTTTAISYLAGCSSIFGYSVITGQPCNGTAVATAIVNAPLLPTTGEGGNALFNTLLLAGAFGLAILGLGLVRKNA